MAEELATLRLMENHYRLNKIETYFPDEGERRRELYPQHLEFFQAGAEHRERCFMAGNRTGKTDACAYETTLHLTGEYPEWWAGRRWNRAIKGWAAGENSKVVREVLQDKLLGAYGYWGTGFIPENALIKVTTKQGIAETADTIYVRHASGGTSSLVFKTYAEGQEAFVGGSLDWFWADEEVPAPIWDEAMVRLMVNMGSGCLSFTPLKGLSEIVLRFLPGGKLSAVK